LWGGTGIISSWGGERKKRVQETKGFRQRELKKHGCEGRSAGGTGEKKLRSVKTKWDEMEKKGDC